MIMLMGVHGRAGLVVLAVFHAPVDCDASAS